MLSVLKGMHNTLHDDRIWPTTWNLEAKIFADRDLGTLDSLRDGLQGIHVLQVTLQSTRGDRNRRRKGQQYTTSGMNQGP